MGLLALNYSRPAYVSKEVCRQSQASSGEQEKTSLRSGKSGVSSGVPNSLSFENIIGGGTCPVR